MGLFCVNFHVRTGDDGAVKAALDGKGAAHRHVLPAQGGWVSAYEEWASRQDETRIRELAEGLSDAVGAPTIAFLVHDSDIACYWLFDGGQLQGQFNSCPDYFHEYAFGGQPAGHAGGDAAVLQQYCRPGVTEAQLEQILGGQTVFADDIVGELAEALGIDPERALSDYRDFAGGQGPGGFGGFGGGDDDDDGDGGIGGGFGGDFSAGDDNPHVLRFPTELAGRFAQQFGVGAAGGDADPQATALVEAAAAGDLREIERLLAAGAPIDDEAPAPLPEGQPAAGLGQLFPGGLPQFPMTPLLTAILHQRREAAELLLARGADPNFVHPLFGTPVHVATGAGNVELLELLLDHGGNPAVRNRQGQTPLTVVATSRATLDRLGQAKAMMKTLGMKMPGILDQLSVSALPTAGWDACERLLQSRSGR